MHSVAHHQIFHVVKIQIIDQIPYVLGVSPTPTTVKNFAQ